MLKRITARLRAAFKSRKRWHRVLRKREARQAEIIKAIRKARRAVRRRRGWRKLLLDPAYRPWLTEEQRAERREAHADAVEELLAAIDALVDRLDRVKDKTAAARAELRAEQRRVKRLRERRKRIKEDREGRASEHFHVAEFDCRDGTPVPEEAVAAVKEWCRTIGERLREQFGAVTITSGYRHAAYNRSIGGASASVHIYDYPGRNGKAVAGDFICERGTPQQWAEFIAGIADGRGLYSAFVHADTRNNIGWPDAFWRG